MSRGPSWRYCVSVRVRDAECDREPDVPITDTVETVGVEPDAEDDPPPPHPVSAIRDKMQTTRIGSPILRRRMQKHPSTVASAVSGTKGELAGRVFTLALADAVIVRSDPPVPATLEGANAHVTPGGSPEHESETDCTNPFNPWVKGAAIPEASSKKRIAWPDAPTSQEAG